ncbi:MAG: hypothetical protein IKQ68_06135 [Prevotella sp.]|nr:hypothetical protein [Prevotella sp.]
MEKLRKQTGKLFLVIVANVLAMVAVAACQGEFYTYQRHFKIEKVYMTRICVDSFPAAPALMYLVESAFSDCPPETIRSDGRYRAVQPYIGGSIDTIESVEFTNKGSNIVPTRLRWHNVGDTLDAIMYLYKEGEEMFFPETMYMSDHRLLPEIMMGAGSMFHRCSYDSCFRSQTYLVCFDRNSPLIDEGVVRFKNREIRIKVNNTPLKLKYAKPIHNCGPNRYQ